MQRLGWWFLSTNINKPLQQLQHRGTVAKYFPICTKGLKKHNLVSLAMGGNISRWHTLANVKLSLRGGMMIDK